MPDLVHTPLDDLTVLDVRGADAIPFLNGQVSHDTTLLAQRGSLLAGLHNPQGRVLCLLRLFHLAGDHVLIVLPQDVADTVRALLARVVLRAKVRIEAAGATWRVYGLAGPDAEAATTTRLHMPMDASGLRQMIVAPRGEPLPDAEATDRDAWRLDDIAAGIPEVGAAISGLFVAQMLNLDLLDAISFSKGCYTGQEIIARAHYRGQVKRRMHRFGSDGSPLPAGTRVNLQDGPPAQLVMGAAAPGGGWEFLAVTGAGTAAPSDAVPLIQARPLPLPG